MVTAELLPPPEECANCGAAIPRSARACLECGADERTGWREDSVYDGLDLPEEAFADEKDTPGRSAQPQQGESGIAWYWWCSAVALLALLLLGALALR